MYYEGSNDGHTLVTYYQLTHWGECTNWENFTVNNFGKHDFTEDPCSYFQEGKLVASTLSLSTLVTIEMFNALNALSEDGSLVQMPPWANPYLIVAASISIGMHLVILYIPALATIFGVIPLDLHDWLLVAAFSFPVILIDEVLKLIGRMSSSKAKTAKDKNA